MRFSLLAPSRARPSNMERLWKTAMETAKHPENVELIFYLDEDDEIGNDKFLEMKKNDPRLICATGPRQEIGSQMWNEAYKKSTGDILMLASDDIAFRTESWDLIVIDKININPDKIGYVWGNDGWIRWRRWGTHGFVHRNWPEAVGYFVPPLRFYGIDDWFTQTARRLARAYPVEEILIEHMHIIYGKSEQGADETWKYRYRHFQQCRMELHALKKTSEYSPSRVVAPKIREFILACKKK